jgi:hypothetical protein
MTEWLPSPARRKSQAQATTSAFDFEAALQQQVLAAAGRDGSASDHSESLPRALATPVKNGLPQPPSAAVKTAETDPGASKAQVRVPSHAGEAGAPAAIGSAQGRLTIFSGGTAFNDTAR